jgi:predicted DNA-binding WGR domain protein
VLVNRKDKAMEKRIILTKGSDIGPMGRGQSGKQKIYEILVTGNTVTFSWGMAEKTKRQVSRLTCFSGQAAMAAAAEKKWAKVDRGYRVVLEA